MKYTLLTLLAVLISVSLTYILVPRPYQVHHHANFAVYIDGRQVDYSGDLYMEEVERCNITEGVRPEDRIHLHDGKGSLVHVHMAASTWGDLFANLSWSIGPTHLARPSGEILTATGSKSLMSYINGVRVTNPANIIVGSTDRLLVWYGTGTEAEIQARFDSLVPHDADEYNHKPDPASCGSNEYGWLSPIAEPIHEWMEHNK